MYHTTDYIPKYICGVCPAPHVRILRILNIPNVSHYWLYQGLVSGATTLLEEQNNFGKR